MDEEIKGWCHQYHKANNGPGAFYAGVDSFAS